MGTIAVEVGSELATIKRELLFRDSPLGGVEGGVFKSSPILCVLCVFVVLKNENDAGQKV